MPKQVCSLAGQRLTMTCQKSRNRPLGARCFPLVQPRTFLDIFAYRFPRTTPRTLPYLRETLCKVWVPWPPCGPFRRAFRSGYRSPPFFRHQPRLEDSTRSLAFSEFFHRAACPGTLLASRPPCLGDSRYPIPIRRGPTPAFTSEGIFCSFFPSRPWPPLPTCDN